MPWHIAIDADDFDRAGSGLDWRDYATGTGAMLADLAAGELDLAVLLTEGAALGLAHGLPIATCSLYTTSPLIWGIHVPPGSAWREPAALEGLRFAISRYGSGSQLMSLALAIAQGWSPEALEFVVVDDLPGAVTAFREGRADVFLWEHYTTEPAVMAGEFRRIGDFVSPWPAWVVCAGKELWQRDRTRIEALLRVVANAAAGLKGAQDAATRIASRYGLREAAVTDWLAQTDWITAPTPPERALADARAMLAAAGVIPAQ